MSPKIRRRNRIRLKSSFLANLSHEIRTPLNAIIGFSTMLHDPEINNEERRDFNLIIRRSSDTLLNLINDVLDFSKIEAGYIDTYIKDIPVKKIVSQVNDIFNLESKKLLHSGTENPINFLVKVPENVSSMVLKTDEMRLMQIIGNLISNAIKFTTKGSIEFGCKEYTGGPRVEFYVKDTGIGIKKEYHQIIFQRFRKIEDDKTQLYRGAGLGLAISFELSHIMGGEISVISEPDKGSTFSVAIPLRESNVQILPNTTPTEKEPTFDFKGSKILIAEDDFSNFFFLEKLLKKTGANVYHAKDGSEAVSMAECIPDIDVILMDIKMPVMDGIQALCTIRQTNGTVPIIAQTAYALADEVTKLKKAGFNNYITKPINGHRLFDMLQPILSK